MGWTWILQLFSNPSTWKWIGVGLAALGIVSAVFAGKSYVENLQNNLAKAQVELATEKDRRQLAEARANKIQKEHDKSIARVQQLENRRSLLESDLSDLNDWIEKSNPTEDVQRDPKKAAADFTARSAELDRVLESLSRGKTRVRVPGTDQPGKASPPRPAKAPQHALGGLWR